MRWGCGNSVFLVQGQPQQSTILVPWGLVSSAFLQLQRFAPCALGCGLSCPPPGDLSTLFLGEKGQGRHPAPRRGARVPLRAAARLSLEGLPSHREGEHAPLCLQLPGAWLSDHAFQTRHKSFTALFSPAGALCSSCSLPCASQRSSPPFPWTWGWASSPGPAH